MNFKPILTYSGDLPLFRSLEAQIVQAIPSDTCEWKRSYGRPIKNVKVEAKFQQLDKTMIEKFAKYQNGEWDLIFHPVLNIFVSECNDVETYKSSVKDEIDSWLKSLQSHGITDWMILIVETIDMKKTKNILPRTTVLDKIRLDFASKNGDRCISILNPQKFENKATESFRSMIQRIRHLMLTGYNKNIVKYEEFIRNNREKRNQEGWSFIKYFLLQEQLAFVLEMLGLYTEALIQYDELDAMFSQFVLNSMFGEKPKWLQVFEIPFTTFRGINMNKREMKETREKIVENTASLLEFRNYLFERQCVLLTTSNKQYEVAERLLPYMFSVLRELEALKIETYNGALACWEFVCCMEVLNLCDQVTESKDIFKCSQHSAPIWNLAKDKLYELGKLCGLLPNFTPTSEQLHIVTQLSATVGDTFPDDPVVPEKTLEVKPEGRGRSVSPNRKPKQSGTDRLKEALGSNKTFQKLYLELSELAISTYKHVSRLRSARLVGLDLGNFYCALNEPNKAVVFFTDLLRELKTENWSSLTSQTLLELANCYKKMDDPLSYTKVAGAISCCIDLEILVRTFYFDEFLKSLKNVQGLLANDQEKTQNIAVLEDHFKLLSVQLVSDSLVIQDSLLTIQIKFDSNFPREILCQRFSINFELTDKLESEVTVAANFESNARLPFALHLDYKQDNSLNCASVVCDNKGKQPVRRTSSARKKISPSTRSDFTNCATIEKVLVHPGINTIELTTKALRVGVWNFQQLSVEFQNLEFLSESIPIKTKSFEVTTKSSSAALNFMNLVAGLDQNVKLSVSGGSFHFPKDAMIQMKCSKGLKIKLSGNTKEHERELSVSLNDFKLFEDRVIELNSFCELPCRRDENYIEHKVSLQTPWSRTEIQIPIRFLPILTASCRLHSSGAKKFLQVLVKSLYESKLILSGATMKSADDGVVLNDLNPKSQNEILVTKGVSVSFLWEIEVEPLKSEIELPVIHIEFNLQYAEYDKPDVLRRFICPFDVTDYKTLYRISVKIEPSELCRVGSVCHLNLNITKVHEQTQNNDLMYEVLFDQNSWAVCGRSAGVISMLDQNQQIITLDVFPLNSGFLPLPNIRLSKYVANKAKSDNPKLVPFAPTQIYNATKSMQLHVLASNELKAN